MSRSSVVKGNVFFNGPRAGVNYNDGFYGGDLLEGNLIFNIVLDTGGARPARLARRALTRPLCSLQTTAR